MSNDTQDRGPDVISRRAAIQRVSALLGGVALIGGSSLMAACERQQDREAATRDGTARFTPQEVAFLDEVADTILPTTAKSPGAKAAQTGAFMALMVTDTYDAKQQQAFRDGMRAIDEAAQKAHGTGFMQATPAQRTALLTQLDREAKEQADARGKRDADKREQEAAQEAAKALSDQRQEAAPGTEAGPTVAAQEEAEEADHYFRMMKQLAMLGYFTSEVGYTKAMRYVETPGRYDGCAPYAPGDKSWAPHA